MSILMNKIKSVQLIFQLKKNKDYISIKKNFYLMCNRNNNKFILKKSTTTATKPINPVTNDFDLNIDLEYMEKNVKLRQSSVDLSKLKSLVNKIKNAHINSKGINDDSIISSKTYESLQKELKKLPNTTHPDVLKIIDNKPRILSIINEPQKFTTFKPLTFKDLTKSLNLLRMEHLGNFNGHKSYYLLGILAQLENALIKYTVDKLKEYKFQIISVPDILPAKIIDSCGMQTDGERTQVYKLKNSNKCLSGTSEMSLAGLYSNEILDKMNLPIKLASVSRCFRAETSGLQEEKGIYRVHQFTKVEMFSICNQNESDKILNEFRDIQMNLFNNLDLHFKVLDMPPYELGNSAYRKYDIEAWMPGKCAWGEISSCSNCTDYQSKRLNIQIKRKMGEEDDDDCLEYVHTVNGTACAVPRMLIALFEQFQTKNKEIKIPKALKPYITNFNDDNEMIITKKNKLMLELKLVKNVNSPGLL